MPRFTRLIVIASALFLVRVLAAQSPAFAACGIDGDCKATAPGTGLFRYREDHPPGANRGQVVSDAAQSQPGQRAENVHREECLAVDAGFPVDVPFCDPAP
jgi:hypothetical protein